MRLPLLVLLFSVVSNTYAVMVELPEDMTSDCCDKCFKWDTELQHPFVRLDDCRVVEFRITTLASATNSVVIRVGRDLNADESLAMDETFFEFGASCNEYQYRTDSFRSEYSYTPPDAGVARERTLTMRLRLSPADPTVVKSVSFHDDQHAFSFEGLTFDPIPAELNPLLWSHVRVLARNGGVRSAEIVHKTDGSLLIVR